MAAVIMLVNMVLVVTVLVMAVLVMWHSCDGGSRVVVGVLVVRSGCRHFIATKARRRRRRPTETDSSVCNVFC